MYLLKASPKNGKNQAKVHLVLSLLRSVRSKNYKKAKRCARHV
jgi:hypothetical protein